MICLWNLTWESRKESKINRILKKSRRIDGMNIEKSSSYLIIKADLVFVLRLFVRISSENRVSQI